MMTVGGLIEILADPHFTARDEIAIVSGKIVIGRGLLVIGEVDLKKHRVIRGIGIRADDDSCEQREEADR